MNQYPPSIANSGVRAGIVVGNPKPASRTFQAAARLAADLTGRAPEPAIDLAAFGAGLPDWSDAEVDAVLPTSEAGVA